MSNIKLPFLLSIQFEENFQVSFHWYVCSFESDKVSVI